MIGNVDDPTEIKRYRDVVEISQSMFVGSYDGLRENRKIETESFMRNFIKSFRKTTHKYIARKIKCSYIKYL